MDIVAGYLMANIDPETQPRRRVAPCFQSKFDFRTVFVRFGFGLFRDFADALPRSKGQLLKVRSREERQTERRKERMKDRKEEIMKDSKQMTKVRSL